MFIDYMSINNIKIGVLLTQWKRPHLEKQLECITKQTLQPDYLIVYQNENHVDITNILKKFEKVIHVKSDFNTKYFGRFAYFFSLPVDICIIIDDDMIPGKNCIKNYVEQCTTKNAIIGGNGRIPLINPNRAKLSQGTDVGIRKSIKVDLVGHMWCFKKIWLFYMFSIPPYTYDTGEDMQLCFSSKLLGNISSYIAEHKTLEDCSDLTMNKLAVDNFSSCNTVAKGLREEVAQYWANKGLIFINSNE